MYIMRNAAYSFGVVSRMIGEVCGYKEIPLVSIPNDYVMFIGNPDAGMRSYLMNKVKWTKIVYSVLEGITRNSAVVDFFNSLKADHYTPSNYARKYHLLSGFSDLEVVPHAIKLGPVNTRYTNKGERVFGYLSGYLERKYPYFLRFLFDKLDHTVKWYVKTSGPNPFLQFFDKYDNKIYGDHDIESYYQSIDVYVNFGSGGGFEMTPLEAIGRGIPTIIPDMPLFRETIISKWRNYPLVVDGMDDFYTWKFGDYIIPVWYYSTDHMAKIINEIANMPPSVYRDLKDEFVSKGPEFVKQYYPLSLYKRFCPNDNT